jgi:hypothetical protein
MPIEGVKDSSSYDLSAVSPVADGDRTAVEIRKMISKGDRAYADTERLFGVHRTTVSRAFGPSSHGNHYSAHMISFWISCFVNESSVRDESSDHQ